MVTILGVIESIENDEQRLLIEKLYRKYSAWVLKIAYEIVQNYDTAKDILNDTFIRLIQYVDVLMEIEEYKIGSYVKQTTYRCAYTYMSKEKHEREKVEKWIQIKEDAADIDFDIEKVIDNLDFYEILKQLNERDRELLIYRYGLCLNYKEIGERCSIPARNVPTYLNRAKNRMKKLLEREM